MLPAGGPSPAHTCGAVLVAAVLLQSVCVAVTYIYFTNELKQFANADLVHSCERGHPLSPPPPPDVPQTAVTRPTKAEGGAAPVGASCSIGQSRRAQSDLRQRAANAASPQHGPPCAARSRARCSCPRCTAGPRVCRRTQQKLWDTYSRSGTACLTGEELGDLIQNLDVVESKDRVADPCWQVKWHLGKLIKKMMSRILQENMSAINGDRTQALPRRDEPPQGPTLRIAAHLTGSSKRSSASPHNYLSYRGIGHKIHSWESSRRGHSFLYNVELWNGELVVPQTGFYYIYSQTYFRFRENEDEDSGLLERIKNPKQLVQYIYKLTNYPDPILLMKSARTSCWSKKAEYGLYSIYQGGVFQLKREDRIFVSVSNSDIVDMDKEASFFGAFMIS
ncbi:tumor necrosis factor ligand superfamily member 10 isoform X2 [Gallus gallus]|uniref:tumor necrosis factor ligand superfamily member 10 isoform X2 n=1 Tax=Gallus gallus TaxID=9031 RepID=UPI000739ABFE|nr:tumor necrosis factor ligand superfamily member 10 isoform X2 [Gallus gallus]|eukprot:XP_015147113.1 tumor necrosis factor ligand superfamily member 10 isoform X2 [Gallus gallus]